MNDDKHADRPDIDFDEIPSAREAIDQETGLPYGDAIDRAATALLGDRGVSSHRLGGATITTDGRITTLDMETTGLSGDGSWPDHCVYGRPADDFGRTPVGASRAKPIRIVADDARWTEIVVALADSGIPVDRQIMSAPEDRVLVLFDVSNPRDMDRLGRFMTIMREADLLRTDVVLLLDGFDHMGTSERERATLSAITAIDLGYDPVEALGGAALFGGPLDVLAITGEVMRHLSDDDRTDRTRVTDLDVIGRMLEVDLERRSRRSTYRCIRSEPRMHLAATALLPEKSGFDHRSANAAPRSARPQRGRRR